MTATKQYFVYILANHGRMLYTGVTNDLRRRVFEHRKKSAAGYTSKYGITRLVYYEATGSVSSAIAREKQIKGWRRERKLKLVEAVNSGWVDLAEGWYDEEPP